MIKVLIRHYYYKCIYYDLVTDFNVKPNSPGKGNGKD